DLIEGLGDLHTTALAATAGVDLRLHHPYLAAELLRGFNRFFSGKTGKPPRRGNAVLAQDLLPLVLVNFQAAFPLYHFGYHVLTVWVLVSSAWHWSSWKGLEPSSPSSCISPAKVWIAAVVRPPSSSVRCVQPRTEPNRWCTFWRKPRTRLRPMSLRYAGAIFSHPPG